MDNPYLMQRITTGKQSNENILWWNKEKDFLLTDIQD